MKKQVKRLISLPFGPFWHKISGMDKKKSKDKNIDKCSEELVRITEGDGKIEIKVKDGEKKLGLLLSQLTIEKIVENGDGVIWGNRLILPPEASEYVVRKLLFMYANTYFIIVQSVTNIRVAAPELNAYYQLGVTDPELNAYYLSVVQTIQGFLASDECKDFPGEFKPFSESIFPETGILKIGWKGFAYDCADFLSKTEKYFLNTPKPTNEDIDLEPLLKHLSEINDKAREYVGKVKHLVDEHSEKENIPPNKPHTKSDGEYEVSWDKENKDYIPLKEAVNLAGDDNITIKKMSKMLKAPDFPVRHMHNGRRCNVHLADFRKWLEYAKHGKTTDKAIAKYLENVEKRKKTAKKNKFKKKHSSKGRQQV